MKLPRIPYRLRNACLAVILTILAWYIAGRLWLASPLAAPALLPPTGPLSIGRTSFHWALDTPAGDPGAKSARREVMAHVWYPASATRSGSTAIYIPEFAAVQGAMGKEALQDAAGGAFEALSTARTHAVADAPLLAEPTLYPVVLLSHGLRFNSLGYTMLAEDLASHGYVVVGVNHPATAFAVVFPDQRVTLFDEALWTARRTSAETQAFELAQVERCAQDLKFVVDQLERLDSQDSSSIFSGRLDLARVGVFGHSFGGRVAARACQLDRRLKAGIICDGFGRQMTIEKNAHGTTVEQPMLVYFARRVPLRGWSRWSALLQTPGRDLEAELSAARCEFCESVTSGSYEVTLNTPGVLHESFSDVPLLDSSQTEDRRRCQKRVIEITRSMNRAFFDRHLAERPAPLLDDFPYSPDEAELTRHAFRVP